MVWIRKSKHQKEKLSLERGGGAASYIINILIAEPYSSYRSRHFGAPNGNMRDGQDLAAHRMGDLWEPSLVAAGNILILFSCDPISPASIDIVRDTVDWRRHGWVDTGGVLPTGSTFPAVVRP